MFFATSIFASAHRYLICSHKLPKNSFKLSTKTSHSSNGINLCLWIRVLAQGGKARQRCGFFVAANSRCASKRTNNEVFRYRYLSGTLTQTRVTRTHTYTFSPLFLACFALNVGCRVGCVTDCIGSPATDQAGRQAVGRSVGWNMCAVR